MNSIIDFASETPLDAREACEHRLLRRGGRPLHRSVLERWWSRGVRGQAGQMVVLGSYRQGGRRVTTAEAIERFIAALNGVSARATNPSQLKREHARAEAELDAVGI